MSELAVLNAPTSLNSGSVFLALSAGTKVLAPATATYEDLQTRVGAGWVHLFAGELDKEIIGQALQVPRNRLPPAKLGDFSLSKIGRDQLRAYEAAAHPL
jgi:hypothetical protein